MPVITSTGYSFNLFVLLCLSVLSPISIPISFIHSLRNLHSTGGTSGWRALKSLALHTTAAGPSCFCRGTVILPRCLICFVGAAASRLAGTAGPMAGTALGPFTKSNQM